MIDRLLAGPRFPEKELILSGASFAEVYAMADSLRRQMGPPDAAGPVCLAAQNKEVVAAALLAALGGGPLLLLPHALSPRALAGLQRARPYRLAITDFHRELPLGVRQLVAGEQSGGSAEALAAPPEPGRRILELFTGGSTGSPRLWTKTAANIVAEGLFLARHFDVTEKDRIIATVSPCHIYGLLFSVVLPLVASASVAAATPSFPDEIRSAVRDNKGTLLAAVPAHYRVLRGRKLSAPELRLTFSSAGMLAAEDNEAFVSANGIGVVEVYGSTETGGIATRDRSAGEGHFTAFPSVRWRVLDGLLAVSSPYISPNLSLDSDGYFLTADRVERQGPGSFSLLGRADFVTKVGGKRVDMEEVRAVLLRQAGVRDSVVLALPDDRGREHRIAALVVGEGVRAEAVRSALSGELEPHALPRRIILVDRIPMTRNGKYDREAVLRLLQSK
jgi:acyl-coenzyme A synthetase/AMP-(fatty) acid ligase